MPRPTILSISSQVAYGHVGNSASIIALQAQGCEVIDIPTIIMSSHPGHGPTAAIEISAHKINEILNVLDDQGRLDKVDAVISGYMRSREQVAIIKQVVDLVKRKNPAAVFCCDPVIGDELPGIYVPQGVAEAIKSELAGISDILTPNLYEFQFLTGQQGSDLAHCIDQARECFKANVLITSVPVEDGSLCGNLLVSPKDAWICTSPHIDKVPNGTGDLLTGLFVGHYLSTRSYRQALSNSCGQLNMVLAKTMEAGSDELVLSPLMIPPSASNFPSAQPV